MVGWEGSLLPAMVVASNRWSADGQATLSTVLYLQREKEGEGEGGREGGRVGGWWGGRAVCYLPWLWLQR